jgi:hypothetical protein
MPGRDTCTTYIHSVTANGDSAIDLNFVLLPAFATPEANLHTFIFHCATGLVQRW